SSADPENERTPSSSHGESCGSCAAAPTAPAASPKPSTPCNSARPHHAEKGSVTNPQTSIFTPPCEKSRDSAVTSSISFALDSHGRKSAIGRGEPPPHESQGSK